MDMQKITNKDEDANYKNFTNLTKVILEKYSSSEEILRSISSNLNTYSWSGSSVPYYENLIELLKPYVRNENTSLKEWASQEIKYYNKRIEREKIRDEEHEWGSLLVYDKKYKKLK